mmetsp:Transcript_4180/g.10747  ORF Transcript_4180/g.10747 Transcript_4180/m.10747 type:complete len:701 (+) Transcript_4180:281-2383(+)
MATADVPACGLPRGRRKRRHPWRQLGALVCAGTVCGSFLAWTTFVSTAPPLEGVPGLITASRREVAPHTALQAGHHQRMPGGDGGKASPRAEVDGGGLPGDKGDTRDSGLKEQPESESNSDMLDDGHEAEDEGSIGLVRPEVTSIQPFSAPSVGGIVVSITGFNLWRRSATNVMVHIGGAPCSGLVRMGPGALECVLPGGVGRELDVSVSVEYDVEGAMESSISRPNKLFSYNDPEVYSVSPQQGRSNGGTRLTITGENFGPSALEDPPQITIGGTSCLKAERFSDTVLFCVSPRHERGVAKVAVLLGPREHQIAAAQELQFVYVTTPAEHLLETAIGMFSGFPMRFTAEQTQQPLVMNRQSLQKDEESTFVDPVTQLWKSLLIPSHLFDILPEKDYSKRFKTCAVVGESKALFDAGKGDEIDGHQAVLRLAHAPVTGFERHVGRKTTVRLGTRDFLLAVATSGSIGAGKNGPTFLQKQAQLKTPIFFWDQLSPDLAAAGKQLLGPATFLAAPWLQSARHSSYDLLFRRHLSLGMAVSAIDAARAQTDEATPEQAAAVLRDTHRNEQSKELANGADSAGEEPETENSPGSKKALDAAKQRDWEETAIEGGDDGEEVEDAGRRLRSQQAASRHLPDAAPDREASDVRPVAGHIENGSDAFLARREPSVEYDAVLLALQLCQEIHVYGFPELTLERARGARH